MYRYMLVLVYVAAVVVLGFDLWRWRPDHPTIYPSVARTLMAKCPECEI